MYIERSRSGYSSSGQLVSHRARFLILIQTEGEDEIRALVRRVALCQCGQFMMGSARAWGERIPISGAYGNDGLPRTVSRRLWEKAVPLPARLRELWNEGGGWNGCGSEAIPMQLWAEQNLTALGPAR